MNTDASPLHLCPFSIVIDTAEQQPFLFADIPNDESRGGGMLSVSTSRDCLGRHPNSHGDYSLYGHERTVAVERKSLDDAHGTILGFKEGRRERFECELANLSEIVSIVVVEASFEQFLAAAPFTGVKSISENRKILYRSYLAFVQDYGVPWVFCESRRLAMLATFRFLERFWYKSQEKRKAITQGAQHGTDNRGTGNSVDSRGGYSGNAVGGTAGSGVSGGGGSGGGRIIPRIERGPGDDGTLPF